VPGRIVIPGHGTIDFSRGDLPLELIKELYEKDFPYLEITPQGKREIYNVDIPGPSTVVRGKTSKIKTGKKPRKKYSSYSSPKKPSPGSMD